MASKNRVSKSSSEFPEDPDARYLAEFISILKEERAKLNLGEREVTRMAEISNGAVGRAEKMERIPSVIVFRKWVRALGLDWVEVCQKADEASKRG